MNSNGILTRLFPEGKLDMISKFIYFDAIVPFKTRFNLDTEYLLTIRSYLAPNGRKAMLNIFDVENG